MKIYPWIIIEFVFIFSILNFASSQIETRNSIWNKYQLETHLYNFRTVYMDRVRNKLYIGGVNALYEFSTLNITQPPTIRQWSPHINNTRTCINFKKNEFLCQNTVGVLQPINRTHLYACGTMAFDPVCIYIRKENFSIEAVQEEGRWKMPHNPDASTVSVFAHQTLFTATEDNLQGNKGLITRTLNGVSLRTLGTDKYWLNDPVFIGGHHVRYQQQQQSQDKIMFFFREKAEEFQPYQYGFASNPQTRTVVSRVATVCANDHGGSPWVLSRKFATYQKMTIVCTGQPDSSEASFRYTHLESTFVMENEQDDLNPTIFGIFTTNDEAIGGSAVCAYQMNDILRALMSNRYWNRQTNVDGIETRYQGPKITGPGMCVEETRELSQSRLTFSENHPIKFGVLFPSQGTPFYQEPSARYTHIVAHKIASNRSSLNEDLTVLYMVTVEGRLKRVVVPSNNPKSSWSLPDIQAVTLESSERVIKLKIGEKDLFVVTNRSITQIPLAACFLYETCHQCRDARDPYCILANDGTCASVYGLESTEIENLNNVCNNFTVPPVSMPDGDLIAELRTNLTYLTQRNAEVMRRVDALTMDRNRRAEAHRECSVMLQQKMLEVIELNAELSEANGNLTWNELNLTQSRSRLSNCASDLHRATEKLAEVNSNLLDQKNLYQNAIQSIINARNAAQRNAALCQEEKENIISQANNCSNNLVSNDAEFEELYNTCTRRRNLELNATRAQLLTANYEMRIMHRAMEQFVDHRNYGAIMSSEKLSACERTNEGLLADSSLLRKKFKSFTNKFVRLKRDLKKKSLLVKRLRWLHRQHGENGQQSCQYNGWFQSNESENLFLLGKMRATFEDSKAICEALGGQLAILTDDAELRYLTNVIRAYAPSKPFWIGLVKKANGSLFWNDGTRLERSNARFPLSQNYKMSQMNEYCVEINRYQRWTLTPCARIKRPICQKVQPTNTPVVSAHSITSSGAFV